jgi:hypothetical protein
LEDPGSPSWVFQLPMFDPDQIYQQPVGYETRQLDEKELLDQIEEYQDIFPSMPSFDILTKFFSSPRPVCPTSLVDWQTRQLLEIESGCKEYHALPYEGGLMDQPVWLLEAFDIIRSERNAFERIRIEDYKKSADSNKDRIKPQLRSENGT